MPRRELIFRLLAGGALGYTAFVLGLLLVMGLDGDSDAAMNLVAGVLAVGGVILAFKGKPRLLFRLAAASLGVICLGFTWLNLIFRDPIAGAAFGLAALGFLLASALLRLRALTIAGCVLLAAALVYNSVTQGTHWTNTLPLALAGLCVAGMSVLLDVRKLPDPRRE